MENDNSTITTSVYDAANRLTTSEKTAGVTTYTYDRNGNQRSIETPTNDITTNSWDYENRLETIELPDNTLVTYVYDPTNKEDEFVVQKQTDLDTIKYIWNNQNILQECNFTTAAHIKCEYSYCSVIGQFLLLSCSTLFIGLCV